MAWFEGVRQRLQVLSPALGRLASARLSDLMLYELGRSRRRVQEVRQRYPSANPREQVQRLVDERKAFAGMVGGVSGVLGLVALPADMLVLSWLQLSLLVDVATVYRVNLKSPQARGELLELFGYAAGLGPVRSASPKLIGKLASALLTRRGFTTVGRAVPVVAAPIAAYLHNHELQQLGDRAVRHFEGFSRAHEKAQKAASA